VTVLLLMKGHIPKDHGITEASMRGKITSKDEALTGLSRS
jgi:hypothetical protein